MKDPPLRNFISKLGEKVGMDITVFTDEKINRVAFRSAINLVFG